MDTILQKDLLNYVLNYYETKRNCEIVGEYITTNSLPILFFGDLKKYFNSDIKIITVGKNPSKSEFIDSINRFPNYRNSPYSLELSLCEYFKHNPYKKWFNHYDKYLNEFGYSFYNNSKFERVIHTDICSPLSTNPIWSKLNKKVSDELFVDGFKIWKKLVLELKPDIIIMCCPLTENLKNIIFKELKLEEIKTIHTIKHKEDNSLRKIPFELTFNDVMIDDYKTQLIYGGVSVINPFGIIGDDNIKLLGEKTKDLINT